MGDREGYELVRAAVKWQQRVLRVRAALKGQKRALRVNRRCCEGTTESAERTALKGQQRALRVS